MAEPKQRRQRTEDAEMLDPEAAMREALGLPRAFGGVEMDWEAEEEEGEVREVEEENKQMELSGDESGPVEVSYESDAKAGSQRGGSKAGESKADDSDQQERDFTEEKTPEPSPRLARSTAPTPAARGEHAAAHLDIEVAGDRIVLRRPPSRAESVVAVEHARRSPSAADSIEIVEPAVRRSPRSKHISSSRTPDSANHRASTSARSGAPVPSPAPLHAPVARPAHAARAAEQAQRSQSPAERISPMPFYGSALPAKPPVEPRSARKQRRAAASSHSRGSGSPLPPVPLNRSPGGSIIISEPVMSRNRPSTSRVPMDRQPTVSDRRQNNRSPLASRAHPAARMPTPPRPPSSPPMLNYGTPSPEPRHRAGAVSPRRSFGQGIDRATSRSPLAGPGPRGPASRNHTPDRVFSPRPHAHAPSPPVRVGSPHLYALSPNAPRGPARRDLPRRDSVTSDSAHRVPTPTSNLARSSASPEKVAESSKDAEEREDAGKEGKQAKKDELSKEEAARQRADEVETARLRALATLGMRRKQRGSQSDVSAPGANSGSTAQAQAPARTGENGAALPDSMRPWSLERDGAK